MSHQDSTVSPTCWLVNLDLPAVCKTRFEQSKSKECDREIKCMCCEIENVKEHFFGCIFDDVARLHALKIDVTNSKVGNMIVNSFSR